jgi:2-hydroxy-3-keto-5-methylthiopentenyl-1-phosphate phosphatase
MSMVRVFCDFDGTVCPQDIGAQFFRKFAGEKAQGFAEELFNGTITMQEWLSRLCEAIPLITREEFNAYIDQFALDSSFGDFVRFAEERGVPLTVLSDGLDVYVERVLSNAGLQRLPFFANHAEFVGSSGGGKLVVTFPYTDAECHLCGNCKRNHMLVRSADEDIIIYCGDGFSDRCPVRFADFVFAKRQLIRYCQQQNITYFEFRQFGDIREKLEEILQRKRIRHRQEAAMARREIFMQG